MVRGPSKKCPYCSYKTNFGADEAPLAMRRLYIKQRNTWEAVGWFCPACGYVALDPSYRFLTHSPDSEKLSAEVEAQHEEREILLEAAREVLKRFLDRDMPEAPHLASALATQLSVEIRIRADEIRLERELKEGEISREEYEREIARLQRERSAFGISD